MVRVVGYLNLAEWRQWALQRFISYKNGDNMTPEPKQRVKLYWSKGQKGGYLPLDKTGFLSALSLQSIPTNTKFTVEQYPLSPMRGKNVFKIKLRLQVNGNKISGIYIGSRGDLSVYLRASTLKSALAKANLPIDTPREKMLFRRRYLKSTTGNGRYKYNRKNRLDILLEGVITPGA